MSRTGRNILRTGFLILLLLITVRADGFAQSHHPIKKFRPFLSDSTGGKLDSLPTLDDSVFVKGRGYEFYKVDKKGKPDGGIKVFSDLDLNLTLQVGEEEERELGGVTRAFYWFGNFMVRLATLTFINPHWGENRIYFDQTVFKTDMRRILRSYATQGYFDAKIIKYEAVMSEDQKYITLKVYIQEGKPTIYDENPHISILSSKPLFDRNKTLDTAKLAESVPTQKGDVLIEENIGVAKSVLQKTFQQNGYPSAVVSEKLDTTSLGRYKARIAYIINPGRYSVFGKTTVTGNYYRTQRLKNNQPDTTQPIVSNDVILKKIRYKAGRTYNPDLLNMSIGQINALGVFRSVKPILYKVKGVTDSSLYNDASFQRRLDSLRQFSGNRLTAKKTNLAEWGIPVDTMNITIDVSDRKERTIKPGVGFTTDFRDLPQKERDKGLSTLPFLSLQLSWQSKNFFGGARKLQIAGQVSRGFQNDKFFANYMQLKTTFRQPSFRIPFTKDVNNDLLLTLSGERNNTFAYDVVMYEASPTLIRQLTRTISLNFTPFSFKKQNIRAIRAVVDTNSVRQVFTTNTLIGLTFNNTNDFFYPSEGFLISLTSDYAGLILPSDLKYLKLSLDNRKYLQLSGKMVLALRVRAGTAIPYTDKNGNKSEIPVPEKYYAGGPNSIRGWGIKEMGIPVESNGSVTYGGGNSILETGAELRYNLFLSKNPNDAITGMDWAVFADAGNVWTEYNFRNVPKELPAVPLVSLGSGVRIRSLIGPIRVDFGYKLMDIRSMKVINNGAVQTISKNAADKVSTWAIQITLGQAF